MVPQIIVIDIKLESYVQGYVIIILCINNDVMTCESLTRSEASKQVVTYRMVKNFGGKKFGKKAALQGLAKKTLANVDLHCQSPIKD